jgi:hypothetical protein
LSHIGIPESFSANRRGKIKLLRTRYRANAKQLFIPSPCKQSQAT